MTLIRSIALARLLAPEDFGLFGITVLGLTALETLSQTGFQPALIQKGTGDRQFLDTAWSVSVVRGILLCSILAAAAPGIAAFFNEPQAIGLSRLMALSFLLSGVSNIGIVLLNRDLDFKRSFVMECGSSMADLVTAVFLAVLFQSVWALVAGVLAGRMARAILSYVVHPYRPRFKIHASALSELFGYGGWVNMAGIIIFMVSYGDDIFVGRLLGADSLGLYQVAFLLANVPATEFTHVISHVTFPAYSKLHEDIYKFRTAFLKVLELTGLAVFPIAAFLFIAARPLVFVLLGQQWISLVPVLKILCVYGAVRAIGATMSPVMYAAGKPRTQALLSGLQLLVMAVLIYPLSTAAGIEGTGMAVTIAMAFATMLITLETRTLLNFSISRSIVMRLLPYVSAVAASSLTVLGLFRILASLPELIVLLAAGTVFVSAYGLVLFLWDRFLFRISDPMRELLLLVFRPSTIDQTGK